MKLFFKTTAYLVLLISAILIFIIIFLPNIASFGLKEGLQQQGYILEKMDGLEISLSQIKLKEIQINNSKSNEAIQAKNIILQYEIENLILGEISSLFISKIAIQTTTENKKEEKTNLENFSQLLNRPLIKLLPIEHIKINRLSLDELSLGIEINRISSENKINIRLWKEDENESLSLDFMTKPNKEIHISIRSDLKHLTKWVPSLTQDINSLQGFIDINLFFDAKPSEQGYQFKVKSQLSHTHFNEVKTKAINIDLSGTVSELSSSANILLNPTKIKIKKFAFDKIKFSEADFIIDIKQEEGHFLFSIDNNLLGLKQEKLSLGDLKIKLNGTLKNNDEEIIINLLTNNQLLLSDIAIAKDKIKQMQVNFSPFKIAFNKTTSELLISKQHLKINTKKISSDQIKITKLPIILDINLLSFKGLPSKLSGKVHIDNANITFQKKIISIEQLTTHFNIHKQNRIKLDTNAKILNFPIRASLSHNIKKQSGSSNFKIKNIELNSLKTTLSQFSITLPKELTIAKGKISIDGMSHWNKKHPLSLQVKTQFHDIGGQYNEAFFSGMNAKIEANVLPKVSGKVKNFSIKTIDAGIPIDNLNLKLDFKLPSKKAQPIISLKEFKMDLLGGQISAKPLKLNLNKEIQHITIQLDRLSLTEITKLQQLENIDANGSISGDLPLVISKDGVTIPKGILASNNPGGVIRYQAKEALKNAALGGQTSILFNILNNFIYHQLAANVLYDEKGNLELLLKLKGRNPEYDNGRPINLNINLEQNILSLLESIRFVNGLSEKLDSDVRNLYQQ